MMEKDLEKEQYIMNLMINCCEELGEHNTPFCTCRDGNLEELQDRVKNRRLRLKKTKTHRLFISLFIIFYVIY